ncbi:hypothetical protein LCGC14_1078890, partial [marine sediment metagenome]
DENWQIAYLPQEAGRHRYMDSIKGAPRFYTLDY